MPQRTGLPLILYLSHQRVVLVPVATQCIAGASDTGADAAYPGGMEEKEDELACDPAEDGQPATMTNWAACTTLQEANAEDRARHAQSRDFCGRWKSQRRDSPGYQTFGQHVSGCDHLEPRAPGL